MKPTEEDMVKGSEWPELPVLSAMSYSILLLLFAHLIALSLFELDRLSLPSQILTWPTSAQVLG